MKLLSHLPKPQRALHILDWILAAAALAYGAWRENPWWIGGGGVLLGLAWYDPGKRLKAWFIKGAGKR